MIVIKIDVTKIPKEKIFIGKKGKYLSLVLFENKHGEDEYGNLGFCAVDTTKEERSAGEKGVIMGNWKEICSKPAAKPQERAAAQPYKRPPVDANLDAPEDEIPF
jgi:hypothetical protein